MDFRANWVWNWKRMRNDHVNVNIGLHDIWFGLESIKINNYFIRASRMLKAVNSTVFRFAMVATNHCETY